MIIDDFLTTFDTLREYADSATFEDVENAGLQPVSEEPS